MEDGENYYFDYKIEFNNIIKDLLLNELSFKKWNEYQQYFATILYTNILTPQDIYYFCSVLIFSKVKCSNQKENINFNRIITGIKSFMNIISTPNYIRNYNINKETIGDLYKKQISKNNYLNNKKQKSLFN